MPMETFSIGILVCPGVCKQSVHHRP